MQNSLDKLDGFYLVSFTTAECLTCDENITTEDWGNLRDIVDRCLAHECGIQYQEDSHSDMRKAMELPATPGDNPFRRQGKL